MPKCSGCGCVVTGTGMASVTQNGNNIVVDVPDVLGAIASSPSDIAIATVLSSPGSASSDYLAATFVRKGELTFNVKDYGATGNGTTDDTTAIQTAENAANSAGGGEVFFPAGTYATTVALTLHTQVRLRGVRGKSTIKVTGAQTSAVSASSRTNPSIVDLTIDANSSSTLTYGVYVNAGSGLSVERVTFTGQAKVGSTAIMLDNGTSDVTIRDCPFLSSKRGVSMIAGSKRIRVVDCRFDTLAEYGTYGVSTGVSQLEEVTISGCRFSNIVGGTPRQPLYFTGGSLGNYARRIKILNNVLIGNYANYNGGTGNGDMIACYDLEDGVVSGNSVLGGGDVGISVWRSRRCTITGNTTGHNNTNGIVLWDAFNCTVTGNTVFNNRQDFAAEFGTTLKGGIRIMNSSSDNVVSGNRCFDDQAVKTQDYGVVIEGGALPAVNTLVTGNQLKGNKTGNYSDLGTTSSVTNNY